MTRLVDAQLGLFDPTRTVERRLDSGVTVRVRLEPLPDQRVRVVEYLRRAKDAGAWQRRHAEEGRVYHCDALGFDLAFHDIFA